MTDSLPSGAPISAAIRAANEQGRPAIVAFLTAGFPDMDNKQGKKSIAGK